MTKFRLDGSKPTSRARTSAPADTLGRPTIQGQPFAGSASATNGTGPERDRMRRTPMQVMFDSVKVESLANGDLRVTPVWRGCRPYTPEDGGGPGMFTRMEGASRLESFINSHLRKAKMRRSSKLG